MSSYFLFLFILFYYYYFSKAWSVPLKSKTSYNILEGFKTILASVNSYPKAILSDKESGVRSKYFNQFCKENNIEIRHPKVKNKYKNNI